MNCNFKLVINIVYRNVKAQLSVIFLVFDAFTILIMEFPKNKFYTNHTIIHKF